MLASTPGGGGDVNGYYTYGNMIDPNQVAVVQGDGISSPDIFGIKIRNLDVLDDNIFCPTDDAQTSALDHAGASGADQTLIARDSDAERSGGVVLDCHRGCIGLVVGAPVVLVDGLLTGGPGAPRRAAGGCHGALGAGGEKRETILLSNLTETTQVVAMERRSGFA